MVEGFSFLVSYETTEWYSSNPLFDLGKRTRTTTSDKKISRIRNRQKIIISPIQSHLNYKNPWPLTLRSEIYDRWAKWLSTYSMIWNRRRAQPRRNVRSRMLRCVSWGKVARIKAFQFLVKNLIWIARCTRPDIYFALHRATRKNKNPRSQSGKWLSELREFKGDDVAKVLHQQKKSTMRPHQSRKLQWRRLCQRQIG